MCDQEKRGRNCGKNHKHVSTNQREHMKKVTQTPKNQYPVVCAETGVRKCSMTAETSISHWIFVSQFPLGIPAHLLSSSVWEHALIVD